MFSDNLFQRKRELLERNRLIQQCPIVTPNGECFSPEPKENKNEISKCISTGNIEHIANNFINDGAVKQNYSLSKSQSGGNIVQTNGIHKNDADRQSSSSASGVSSPSNNSQRTDSER